MTLAPRPVRATGFTLLPVILAMSLIAAIAFLLNRDNGVNARMIGSRSDLDRARYAAEAGLQAVNFVIQGMGCTGTNYPTSTTPPPLTNTNFGGATYSAYANTNKLPGGNPPPPISLSSTGSYNGASVTLTRAAYVYQSPMTIIVRPGDTNTNQPAGYDTYVDSGSSDRNFGGALVMKLSTTPSNFQPLLKFDLRQSAPGGFPPGSRAIPWYGVDPPSTPAKLQPGAKLSLYMSSPGSAGSSGSVNAQLITQNWVAGTGTGGTGANGATWDTYDGYVGPPPPPHTWLSPRYAPAPVASIPYTNVVGWYDWDLTNAAAAWMSGVYTNYGIWLVGSPAAGQNIGNTDYVSSNATTLDTNNKSARPKLTLNTLLPCGTTAPPSASDTVTAATTVTLAAAADTYITADTNNSPPNYVRNYGKDTTMYVGEVGTGPSLENRMLLRFDLSAPPPAGIPQGKTVTSATLRLFMNKIVGQAGANATKNLDAYALTQWWAEGTSQSSGNPCGATWISRDCQNGYMWSTWTGPGPVGGGGTYGSSLIATGRVEGSGVDSLPAGFSSGWVTWDLTTLAQAWVDYPSTNYGILVKSRYPGDITYSLEFLTKENNSAGGKYAPQLVVVYQ